jgi:uncharacterized membrane protein
VSEQAPDPASRLFSAALMAIGVYGLVSAQFVAFWPPLVPAPSQMNWVSGAASLLGGAGLQWRATARPAAGILLVTLVVWLALFKAPAILAAPSIAASWESMAETVVIMAALLCAFKVSYSVHAARLLFGVGVWTFGIAHFAYVAQTAALVPKWLPAHAALVFFTGAVFVISGTALVLGIAARSFAILAAIQMGLFTFLVWLPKILAGIHDVPTLSEFLDSTALTAAAAVMAWNMRDRRPFGVLSPRRTGRGT